MSAENAADLPLAGIRVLDVASYIAAPVAATILADFGADVIKIEAPAGDGCRRLHTMPGMPVVTATTSKSPIAASAVCASPARRQARCLRDQSAGTGAPQAGADACRFGAANRRLVYASLTAYGETGPEADTTGFD